MASIGHWFDSRSRCRGLVTSAVDTIWVFQILDLDVFGSTEGQRHYFTVTAAPGHRPVLRVTTCQFGSIGGHH